MRELGIELVGVADLRLLTGIPSGLPTTDVASLGAYTYAIVMGAQIGKLGRDSSGDALAIFLEKAALAIAGYITESSSYAALIVHPEDEFDSRNRIGLLSLKALAKAAGLGWQGRSLLIVSPDYGPIHRLIAVLTDMPLTASRSIPMLCESCSICIEKCPTSALTYVAFTDHPNNREDVLDIGRCLGDHGCMVCMLACPWAHKIAMLPSV